MEWIKVKERLPSESGFYLIYPNESGRVSYYASHLKEFAAQRLYKDQVTHWMPLPEPPNE